MKSYLKLATILCLLLSITSCQAPAVKNACSTKGAHLYNQSYSGEHLERVAFPIGGIGAGMYCVEGTGYISHMSVRNRPQVFHEPGIFAALSVKGLENGAKVLEGPVPEWRKFGAPGSGNGASGANYGLPRFQEAEFLARFPFAEITLKDGDIPVRVSINAWSPFIPADPDNSSLPVGMLEYTFENVSGKTLETVFSFNTRNFMRTHNKGENSVKPMNNGFILSQSGTKEEPFLQGDFAVYTDQPNTIVNHCWFRGGWFDGLTMAWNTVKDSEADRKSVV